MKNISKHIGNCSRYINQYVSLTTVAFAGNASDARTAYFPCVPAGDGSAGECVFNPIFNII